MRNFLILAVLGIAIIVTTGCAAGRRWVHRFQTACGFRDSRSNPSELECSTCHDEFGVLINGQCENCLAGYGMYDNVSSRDLQFLSPRHSQVNGNMLQAPNMKTWQDSQSPTQTDVEQPRSDLRDTHLTTESNLNDSANENPSEDKPWQSESASNPISLLPTTQGLSNGESTAKTSTDDPQLDILSNISEAIPRPLTKNRYLNGQAAITDLVDSSDSQNADSNGVSPPGESLLANKANLRSDIPILNGRGDSSPFLQGRLGTPHHHANAPIRDQEITGVCPRCRSLDSLNGRCPNCGFVLNAIELRQDRQVLLTARPVNNIDNSNAQLPVITRRHPPQSPPMIPVSALRTRQVDPSDHTSVKTNNDNCLANDAFRFHDLPHLTDDMNFNMENYLPPEYSKLSPSIDCYSDQPDSSRTEPGVIRLQAVPVSEALLSPYRKTSSPRVNSLLPHHPRQPSGEQNGTYPSQDQIESIQIQAMPIFESPRVQAEIHGLSDKSGNSASGLSDR